MPLRRSPIWSDPRVKPPFGSVALDRGHSSAPDFVWLLNETAGSTIYDLGGRQPGTVTLGAAQALWQTSARGTVMKTAPDVRAIVLATDSTLLARLSGGFTIILHYRTITSQASSAFGVQDTASAERCHAHINLSGTTYFDYGGADEGTTRLSIGGLTYGDDLWCFTTGPRGMEIWQNGIKRASNAANPSRSASAGSFQLMSGNTASETAQSAFCYIFQKQAPTSVCAQLTLQPYDAFLRPIIRRRDFVPAAAAAGNPWHHYRQQQVA